jgi:hypothetical protein
LPAVLIGSPAARPRQRPRSPTAQQLKWLAAALRRGLLAIRSGGGQRPHRIRHLHRRGDHPPWQARPARIPRRDRWQGKLRPGAPGRVARHRPPAPRQPRRRERLPGGIPPPLPLTAGATCERSGKRQVVGLASAGCRHRRHGVATWSVGPSRCGAVPGAWSRPCPETRDEAGRGEQGVSFADAIVDFAPASCLLTWVQAPGRGRDGSSVATAGGVMQNGVGAGSRICLGRSGRPATRARPLTARAAAVRARCHRHHLPVSRTPAHTTTPRPFPSCSPVRRLG